MSRTSLCRFLFPASIFGVAFCITLFHQALRTGMSMGSVIHFSGTPAPWMLMLFVPFPVGMACFVVNEIYTTSFPHLDRGDNLMQLAGPGFCFSIGWNSLEFAFALPAGKIDGGLLFWGVVFVLAGGLILLGVVREFLRARKAGGASMVSLAWQGLMVGIAIVAAIVVFRALE